MFSTTSLTYTIFIVDDPRLDLIREEFSSERFPPLWAFLQMLICTEFFEDTRMVAPYKEGSI